MSEHVEPPKLPIVARFDQTGFTSEMPVALTRFPRRHELVMKLGKVAPKDYLQTIYDERQADADEFFENTPNLNEQFAEEIQSLTNAFAEEGFAIAPIVVLAPAEFGQAQKFLDEKRERKMDYGYYGMGYSVVRFDPEQDARFGGDLVLSMAAHESAHSISPEYGAVVKYRETVDPSKPAFLRDMLQAMRDRKGEVKITSSHGMLKPVWRQGGIYGSSNADRNIKPAGHKGSFWEEAYADLKRVRILKKMGRQARFPDSSWHEHTETSYSPVTRYVDDTVDVPLLGQDGTISTPVEFLNGVTSINGRQGEAGVPGMAAYALELLDERLPGLFDDLEQGRFDPDAQRRFIRRVNSIEPGLYQMIRHISQETEETFTRGFRQIVHALDLQDDNVHHLRNHETGSKDLVTAA
jgi:hypothetical protein